MHAAEMRPGLPYSPICRPPAIWNARNHKLLFEKGNETVNKNIKNGL